jgi:flagellar hook-associated protein 2
MSGISTGSGFFSGIDSASLIDQLIAAESAPKRQVQSRIAQLQLRSAAFLDLNSKLSALKTAASGFRINNTFATKAAASSNKDIATGTAGISAIAGSYQFVVDRLVSTQQALSKGFADKDASGLGLTKLTLEGTEARLDRDVALSDLNDGSGVQRGKIIVTDSSGARAEVDLSKTGTIGEVLDAINNNGTARVTATAKDGKLIIKDNAAGPGSLIIANATGSTTATSLGIAGSATGTLNGTDIYSLNSSTTLTALNDGRGVSVKDSTTDLSANFEIKFNDGGTIRTAKVNLSRKLDPTDNKKVLDGPATSVGKVIERINEALSTAGITEASAQIDRTNGSIRIVDSRSGTTRTIEVTEAAGGTTAADLGLATTAPLTGAVNGKRILSGLNTTLASGLNGGSGIEGDGSLIFRARDGFTFGVTINTGGSLTDIFDQVATASGGRIKLSLNNNGTGIRVTDTTGSTAATLLVTGSSGFNSAESLGIETAPAGVASATVEGTNLQRKYLSNATTLASLKDGKGIGTGTFRIIDTKGIAATIDITANEKTIADVIEKINSKSLSVKARINGKGDGLELFEDTGSAPAGANKIKVEEVSGSVAKSFNILGEAAGLGTANKIDGSYERSITVSAADTMQTIAEKINSASAGVSATIIKEGTGSAPFRLSLAATSSGESGRFIVDTGATDLGLTTLDKGQDARVFFGTADPAKGIIATSSTNTIDGLVQGLAIDLKQTSATPVTVSVSNDTASVVSSVQTFVKTFNTLLDRIDSQSSYNSETRRGGPLLGDGATRSLKESLYATLAAKNTGFSSRYNSLYDVGITVSSGGEIKLDSAKLEKAIATDPQAVQDLFTSRTVNTADKEREVNPGDPTITVTDPETTTTFSKLSVVGQIEELANRYITTAGGVLTNANSSINTQVKALNTRLTTMDERLDRRRAQLTTQFQAMEKAIGQLRSQQSALGSIGAR